MPTDRIDEQDADRDRLHALAANTNTVVWNTAPDGAIVKPNASWEAFTGQPFDEYRGRGWTLAVHPSDREEVIRAWQQATAQCRLFEHAYRLRRRDGEYRHVQSQGTPVMGGSQVREWVGVCVDITVSRRAQIALQESELRFRFLDRLGQATRGLNEAAELMAVSTRLLGEYLGATRCAYADVDADSNRFTIRNDWSEPGVPSSVGVYSLELFGPQATTNLRQGRHLVVRDVDRELGDEGGGRMFNAIGIKAVICAGLVKHGRLVAMMAVHQSQPRDWTHREITVVEEVVDRCWAHIERVRDNAILREQDRRKDEFLATLAHELRNPLAPIKYALALMRASPDEQRAAKAQDVIDRQVTRMSRLIDDLLDLSRVNRGLIRLQVATHPLSEVLREAADVARPAIEEAGHQLRMDPPEPELHVNGDATRLVQVVGNLLGNAAKYTPPGGQIKVRALADGDQARIEVADNGMGIAAEDQPRLFQMFTQLEHTASHSRGGLGIGLALVKSLVQLHGGTVDVRSAGIGQGATFTVRLPLAARPAAISSHDGPSGGMTAQGRSLDVLVVEDNDDGRVTLVHLLEQFGHRVRSAADGLAAIDQAQSVPPDVVLLDLGLPALSGEDVCRRLRADQRLGGTRIIALTGWGTECDRERTRAAGFDMHLTKPVEPARLVQLLSEMGSSRS